MMWQHDIQVESEVVIVEGYNGNPSRFGTHATSASRPGKTGFFLQLCAEDVV